MAAYSYEWMQKARSPQHYSFFILSIKLVISHVFEEWKKIMRIWVVTKLCKKKIDIWLLNLEFMTLKPAAQRIGEEDTFWVRIFSTYEKR